MAKFYTLLGDNPPPNRYVKLDGGTFWLRTGKAWSKVADIRFRNYLLDRLESGDGVLVPSTPAEIAKVGGEERLKDAEKYVAQGVRWKSPSRRGR